MKITIRETTKRKENMELKSIFQMTKTDRYTQDGRDELAKLQETEDVKYKTGDISQKTGLQKQPDGSWAPPKKGAGNKSAAGGEKPTEKHPPKVMPKGMHPAEFMKAWEDDAKKNGYKKGQGNEWRDHLRNEENNSAEEKKPSIPTDKEVSNSLDELSNSKEMASKVIGGVKVTYNPENGFYKVTHKAPGGQEVSRGCSDILEAQQAVMFRLDRIKKGEIPAISESLESNPAEEKPERFNYRAAMEKEPRSAFNFKGTVSHSIPMNQTDYDELNGLAKFMNEEKATYQNALKSRAQALVDGHKSNGDWYPEKEQSIMKIAKAVGFDEELHKFIEEENRGYDLGYSEDAAPKIRELTGDCKIKIRQTQDVKYKTGDISQKTGLQKQPDGSWAPPKTGKTPGSKPEEQTATEAAKTSQEKPARKSLNQIMLEKKGFKRVENSTGPRANMPRYQYTSRIGKTYNV